MGWFNIQYSISSSWLLALSQRSVISHLLFRRSSQSCEGRHRRWGKGRQAWRHWKEWWKILNRWKNSETGAFYQVRQWNPSWRADRGLNTLYMKVGRCINMARSISGRISKPSQSISTEFFDFSFFNVRLTMPMQYLNFSLPTQRCELRWEQLQRELPRWPTGCEADFVLTLFVFFLSKTVVAFL